MTAEEIPRLGMSHYEQARALPPTSNGSSPAKNGGSCPICHGVGFVRRSVPMADPDFGQALPCECVKLNPIAGVPQLYREARFDTFDLRLNPGMMAAVNASMELAAGETSNVFLYGPPGLGKTHLLISAVRASRERGFGAWFWEAPELLAHLRRCIGSEDGPNVDDEIERLGSGGFLLGLDDLGAHNPTGWAEEQLYRILNRRYVNSAPTIITSNAALEAIDSRIRSRYRAGVIFCEGNDVR